MSDFVNRMRKIANGGMDEPIVRVEKETFSGTLPEIAKIAPKGVVADVIENRLHIEIAKLYGSKDERKMFVARLRAATDKPDGTEDILIVTKMLANMIEMDMRGEPVDMEKAAKEVFDE
jgi:hypothetical protein